MGTDIDDDLLAGNDAHASFIQVHLDGLRSREMAAAHYQLGPTLAVSFQMRGDLPIDHILLTIANPAHGLF